MICFISLIASAMVLPFVPAALPVATDAMANNCAQPICQEITKK